MKAYQQPRITVYGDIVEITATLGDPFTGDQSFDVDGNVIEEGLNSVNQCPTVDNEGCFFNEGGAP
ncbi:MAG: hypothetical protein AAGI91_13840 [Bacteroidota bacterium]